MRLKVILEYNKLHKHYIYLGLSWFKTPKLLNCRFRFNNGKWTESHSLYKMHTLARSWLSLVRSDLKHINNYQLKIKITKILVCFILYYIRGLWAIEKTYDYFHLVMCFKELLFIPMKTTTIPTFPVAVQGILTRSIWSYPPQIMNRETHDEISGLFIYIEPTPSIWQIKGTVKQWPSKEITLKLKWPRPTGLQSLVTKINVLWFTMKLHFTTKIVDDFYFYFSMW